MEDFREDINRVPSCNIFLTEVAGEGGTDWAPQKFLLSQQFRYLMRCKKYLKNSCISETKQDKNFFKDIFCIS